MRVICECSPGEKRAYSGHAFSPSWGLVMAGGVDTEYLSTVVTNKDGYFSSTEYLPDLPEENVQSCLTVIDDDLIFTCGGYFQPRETYIFLTTTNTWSR